ncbi:hypothetical protein [Streptosporangium sp. NPDC003464]
MTTRVLVRDLGGVARRHGWHAVRSRTPDTLADTLGEHAAPEPSPA